jgi:hypothetical protein
MPPSDLELNLTSSPPRRAAPSEPVSPFGGEPQDSGRVALVPGGGFPDLLSPHSMPTVSPEPGSRLSAGATTPEVALEPESHSPLDLVETYRRSVANMPAVRGPDTEQQGEKSPDSGDLQDMQDRYAVGDFTGALVVAESLLDADPDNEDAKRYAQSCREVLTQMYAARIGPMGQVATVAVPPEQIIWLSLDHRAGFLLSLVDGVSSIEEILDISGMNRLDALRIMYTLVQQNVIALAH